MLQVFISNLGFPRYPGPMSPDIFQPGQPKTLILITPPETNSSHLKIGLPQ